MRMLVDAMMLPGKANGRRCRLLLDNNVTFCRYRVALITINGWLYNCRVMLRANTVKVNKTDFQAGFQCFVSMKANVGIHVT